MKKALIIGIDKYSICPLSGCENDAVALATLLETNGDGSPNFDIRIRTSDNDNITAAAAELEESVGELFSGSAETVLFYFAGHGLINPITNNGFLVTQDGKKGAFGLALSDLLAKANNAHPEIRSTVIILDCCYSGAIGEVPALGNDKLASIGAGVTILTSCERNQTSLEFNGHGLFTGLLLEALKGASADVCGRITPAGIYAMIDQTLGGWDQRPIYKANVKNFITLRNTVPRVPMEVMRNLHKTFPSPTYIYKLDPSFEPDRGEEAGRLSAVPVIDSNVQIYRNLQKCYQNGLVIPVDQPHMWHAAVFSTGCRLTSLGAHFRKLAESKRI